jgi:hypothetical protein
MIRTLTQKRLKNYASVTMPTATTPSAPHVVTLTTRPSTAARGLSVREKIKWRSPPHLPRHSTQEMSLLDRIMLLERSNWYPTSCTKCRRADPKHTELECPLYEMCPRCWGNGAYGYVRHHVCYPVTSNDDGWDNYEYDNNTDYNLYWGNSSS